MNMGWERVEQFVCSIFMRALSWLGFTATFDAIFYLVCCLFSNTFRLEIENLPFINTFAIWTSSAVIFPGIETVELGF